jgi:hypothetical protein
MNKNDLEAFLYWYVSKTWRKQELGFDSLHRSDPCKPSDPKSWVLTMCPTKLYRSIDMSSRGSQKLFYQRKFKSLHGVKRSVKKKIWIPLERGTWRGTEEFDGDSKGGPRESDFHPILHLLHVWILRFSWGKRGVKGGGERVFTASGWKGCRWMRDEREGRGVKG